MVGTHKWVAKHGILCEQFMHIYPHKVQQCIQELNNIIHTNDKIEQQVTH